MHQVLRGSIGHCRPPHDALAVKLSTSANGLIPGPNCAKCGENIATVFGPQQNAKYGTETINTHLVDMTKH